MIFEWKPGSIHKVDANTAGAVCEQLEAAGRLSAKDLLEVSRSEEAPLHPEFEWDDGVAAEKYREGQASGIIRHLAVRLNVDAKEPVRSFFRVALNEEQSYTGIETILVQRDLRERLLRQALCELEAFRRKFSTLSELAGIFEAAASIKSAAFPADDTA